MEVINPTGQKSRQNEHRRAGSLVEMKLWDAKHPRFVGTVWNYIISIMIPDYKHPRHSPLLTLDQSDWMSAGVCD